MKQLLLTLGLILTLGGGLLAQDVIWTADFNDGMRGWTSRTSLCDRFQGGMFGTWNLTGAAIAGTPVNISALDFQWSFMTPDIYTIDWEWNDGTDDYGTVYANYGFQGDTLLSTIDGASVAVDTTVFALQGNNLMLWSVLLGDVLPPSDLPVVLHLIGANDPIVTMDGTTMTMTSQDGAVVLTYERDALCGDLWYWSANNNWGLGYTTDIDLRVLPSLTADVNGCAVVSPFHLQRLEGFPFPYPDYFAELISPPIDISAADQALAIELTQTYQLLNAAPNSPGAAQTSVQVSVDDGMTWSTAAIDLAPNVEANTLTFADRDVLIVPSALIGGATEIRLKFNFSGDFYHLAIDDVVVRERDPYDVQVNQNFFAIAPNYATPYSQFTPMAFMADIQNNGGATAEGVNLNIQIYDGTNTSIYNADKNYGAIVADSLAENDFIPGVFDLNPDTTNVDERFVGEYVISHDSIASESRTNNDTLSFDFVVTDTLFSKAPERSRNLFFTTDNSYYFGNVYYTPSGDGWFARTVSFAVDNPDEIAAFGGNTATISIYEWTGDQDDSGTATNDEYTLLAATEYEFSGTEPASGLITVGDFRDFLTDEPVSLKNDRYYFAMVQFVATAPEDTYLFTASEDYNYGAMAFISDSLANSTGAVPQQYGGVFEIGNPPVPEFGFIGFVVPLVDMSIGLNPDLGRDPLVFNDNVLPADYQLTTFPNPATEFINLNLNMPETQDVAVTLLDMQGRNLFFQKYDDLRTGNFQYDVSTLPAGVYFLRVSTPAGMRTLKVSVQR